MWTGLALILWLKLSNTHVMHNNNLKQHTAVTVLHTHQLLYKANHKMKLWLLK